MFICLPAYAFVLVLISIENIPHLVQTGPVELEPTRQIIQLFNVLVTTAQSLMVVCAIGGAVFGLLILIIRKFLKIKPVSSLQATMLENHLV
ncbi:MAG: hypothetical protein JNK32_08685 [Anaerolineales bacterium]|nr:hypothetical protein [Anaerolineales bacterium]